MNFEKEFIKAVAMNDSKKAEEIALAYMQGITNKIRELLNPISSIEAPFVIAAMEICAEFIGQSYGKKTIKIAHELKENIGYTGISIPIKK